MMKMQANIKNNSNDLQNYMDELFSWEKNVAAKDKDPKKRDPYKNVSAFV